MASTCCRSGQSVTQISEDQPLLIVCEPGVSKLFQSQPPVYFIVATRTHRLVLPSTQFVKVRQSVPGVVGATGRNRVLTSSGKAAAAFNSAFEYRP